MNTLIVARHNEDVKWTTCLPKDWTVRIVQKDEDLPNEGREAGSYIWAFQNLSFKDDDLIGCVQGNPFVHAQTLVRELYLRPNEYRPFRSWEAECDGEGGPHHKGLPVAESYEEWFKKVFPGRIVFHTGAQFMVRGKDLRKKDWDMWYARACEEHGPWLMERFWGEVFNV